MKGLLSKMVVCVAVGLATAGPQCDLGNQTDGKVGKRQFTNGLWKTKYVLHKTFSREVGRCWMDNYTPISNETAHKLSTYKSPKTGEIFSVVASVQLVEDCKMNMTFLNGPPELSAYSGIYHILAWDEDKGYFIAGGCPSHECIAWIAYRQYPPSEDSVEASKAALKKAGIKHEDFHEHCE